MLLNLFTAIGAPLYVYAAEFKQFGVWIAGDDFFETANLPQPSSVSLGAPASLSVHAPECNSFIERAGKSQANLNYIYPVVNFSTPFFRAIWWTLIDDSTNIGTKSESSFS